MSNQVIERKPNGQFAKGVSGNLGGNAQRTRHIFNKAFLEALANDFREGGPQAIAKVRKYQPAAYMKICALLVPREMRVEHTGGVKAMTDEQIEQAIEAIQAMLEQRAGESAKLIGELRSPPRSRHPRRSPSGLGLSQSASAGRTD
jgi:hypothetical protein